MRSTLLLLSFFLLARAEDVLTNQCSGGKCVAVPAGDWTDITSSVSGLPGSRLPYYVTGWDKAFYVPAIDAVCSLSSYFEPSSEPNRSWACYSFAENRWWMVDMGSSWHDEHHPEGGHPMGWVNVDPTTSVALGPCCFSGSQASEQIRWGMWRYDFAGNVGIPQMTATSLTQANQLGSGAYDSFDQLLIGLGGDSANQGSVLYNNNPSYTSNCSSKNDSGIGCYNTYRTGEDIEGGPPASIIEHATALNTTDKKIYIFGGFYSGASQNAVYVFAPTAKTWAKLAYTCRDALGGSNCPIGRVLAGWAYDANENLFLLHGGMVNPSVPGIVLTDTWVFDPVNLQFRQVRTSHAPRYMAILSKTKASLGKFDSSFTVEGSSGFVTPATLQIDSEVIYCSGIIGGTYSGCTRGYENTVATEHAAGAPVIGGMGPIAPNERLVWVPEDDVFLLMVAQGQGLGECKGESPSCPRLWAFRYASGGHAGYRSRTRVPTQIAGVGPLNRNELKSSRSQLENAQSFAMGSALAASGPLLYQLWTETAVTQIDAEPVNSWLSHPYAQVTADGTIKMLGLTYSSMAADVNGSPVEAFDPSIAVVRKYPWACWDQQNINSGSEVECRAWDGSGWNAGGPVGSGTAATFSAHPKIVDSQGVPTVLFREQDRGVGSLPYPTYAYVKQWNGSSFTLLGSGKVNSGWTSNVVDSADIASDETSLWVVTSEYLPSNSAKAPRTGVVFTTPQVFLYRWSGSKWQKYCGSAANVEPTEVALNVSITVMKNAPYVSFVERSHSGSTQSVYVRTCDGSTWTTVGGGALNRDRLTGWAFRAELANDGSNLYAAWVEQGNSEPWVQSLSLSSHYNQKPHLYVARWGGSSWSAVGGALNADTADGSASYPAMVILDGNPVVQWGEILPKNLRQMYVKRWNGRDWGPLAGTGSQ